MALAVLLGPSRRSILRQPPPQVAGLADVEQRAGRVVQAIDAGSRWNAGEKVGAKLPVERAHAPLSQRGRGFPRNHRPGALKHDRSAAQLDKVAARLDKVAGGG